MAAPFDTLTGMNVFWRSRSTRNREWTHSASKQQLSKYGNLAITGVKRQRTACVMNYLETYETIVFTWVWYFRPFMMLSLLCLQ